MASTLRDHEETDLLLFALSSIACESTDTESVRLSLVALYETSIGRAHLTANPIKL